MAAYLEAAMEEAPDDPAYITAVLNDIARARGIMKLANDTGMTRAGLYKALAPDSKLSIFRLDTPPASSRGSRSGARRPGR